MKCQNPFYHRSPENDLIEVPCRHCIPCTINKIQALNFYAECERASQALKGYGSSFIRLSYNNANLPVIYENHLYRLGELIHDDKIPTNITPTILRSDFQKFMKRIRIDRDRKKLSGTCFYRQNWKYIYNGEYGDINGRPHMHILFFGIGSQEIQGIFNEYWNYGFIDYKPLKSGAVRYCSEYMFNDVFGEEKEKKYTSKGIEPPFLYHSKKLGFDYFYNHADFETGFIMLNGQRKVIPQYIRQKYGIKIPHVYISDTEIYNKSLAYVGRQQQRGVPVDYRKLFQIKKNPDNQKIDLLVKESLK